MIKIIFFDFSRTVGKDSGFGAGPDFLGRKNDYEKFYAKYKSHNIDEAEYIKSVVTLWKSVREKDLQKIYHKIRLNSNIKQVLRKLKKMKIKLALISNMPSKLAELYKLVGFDCVFGTDCEVKNGFFTGKVKKMNPDKGVVIKDLCKKLHIPFKQSMAVGDGLGDIKMFKIVSHDNSVAYNAQEEVKKHAKYHIKDFKELIKIIKKLK